MRSWGGGTMGAVGACKIAVSMGTTTFVVVKERRLGRGARTSSYQWPCSFLGLSVLWGVLCPEKSIVGSAHLTLGCVSEGGGATTSENIKRCRTEKPSRLGFLYIRWVSTHAVVGTAPVVDSELGMFATFYSGVSLFFLAGCRRSSAPMFGQFSPHDSLTGLDRYPHRLQSRGVGEYESASRGLERGWGGNPNAGTGGVRAREAFLSEPASPLRYVAPLTCLVDATASHAISPVADLTQ